MEFIEMLKADERFLYVLLTLSQEKNIKTGRFPLIYADECVVSHTNETEFNEFLGNKKSEALHDRMIMVRIPYNLKVSQEERIYQKLLRATSLEDVHIAPHTLRVAAIFAVLSRLEEPKMSGLTLLKKLKLYDGEDVEGFRQKDVKLIKEQTEREGMDGITPRFIINRVSTSLIRPETRCINPIDNKARPRALCQPDRRCAAGIRRDCPHRCAESVLCLVRKGSPHSARQLPGQCRSLPRSDQADRP